MITVGIISKPEHTRGLKAALAKTGRYKPVLLGADPGRVSVPTAVKAVVCRMRSVSHDAGDVALALRRARADLPVIFANGSSRAIQQLNEIFSPNIEEPMKTLPALRWLIDNLFFAPSMRRMPKKDCVTLYEMVKARSTATTSWYAHGKKFQATLHEALDAVYRASPSTIATSCSGLRSDASIAAREFHVVIQPEKGRARYQPVTYYCLFGTAKPLAKAMAKRSLFEECWGAMHKVEVFSRRASAKAHCRYLLSVEDATDRLRHRTHADASYFPSQPSSSIRGTERAAIALSLHRGEKVSIYEIKKALAHCSKLTKKGVFARSHFSEVWERLLPTRADENGKTTPWEWRDRQHVDEFVRSMHAMPPDKLALYPDWANIEIGIMETLEGWGYPVEWPEVSVGVAIRDSEPTPTPTPTPETSETELQTLIGMVKDALRRAGKIEYALDGVHMSCTAVHWSSPWHVCSNQPEEEASTQLSAVTCPECLNSEHFTQAQWIINNCGRD